MFSAGSGENGSTDSCDITDCRVTASFCGDNYLLVSFEVLRMFVILNEPIAWCVKSSNSRCCNGVLVGERGLYRGDVGG